MCTCVYDFIPTHTHINMKGQSLMLAAVGPSSVHAAVLGIALGSLYMQEEDDGSEITFRPEFTTVELGSSSSSKLVTLRLILNSEKRRPSSVSDSDEEFDESSY